MKDLKITKGKYVNGGITKTYPKSIIVNVIIDVEPETPFELPICHVLPKANGSKELNAELIIEAFNVANETGKTPRQLADENAKLLEALKNLLQATDDEGWCNDDGNDWEEQKEAREAIKSAES